MPKAHSMIRLPINSLRFGPMRPGITTKFMTLIDSDLANVHTMAN
ncbi:MAG: hypothetical protein ACI9I0_000838 [Rhodoferax sp.]|jgi:hypothetical protein